MSIISSGILYVIKNPRGYYPVKLLLGYAHSFMHDYTTPSSGLFSSFLLRREMPAEPPGKPFAAVVSVRKNYYGFFGSRYSQKLKKCNRGHRTLTAPGPVFGIVSGQIPQK
jgi:hypothetical protein